MDIIRDENPLQKSGAANQKYSKDDFLGKVYMTEERYDVTGTRLPDWTQLFLWKRRKRCGR